MRSVSTLVGQIDLVLQDPNNTSDLVPLVKSLKNEVIGNHIKKQFLLQQNPSFLSKCIPLLSHPQPNLLFQLLSLFSTLMPFLQDVSLLSSLHLQLQHLWKQHYQNQFLLDPLLNTSIALNQLNPSWSLSSSTSEELFPLLLEFYQTNQFSFFAKLAKLFIQQPNWSPTLKQNLYSFLQTQCTTLLQQQQNNTPIMIEALLELIYKLQLSSEDSLSDFVQQTWIPFLIYFGCVDSFSIWFICFKLCLQFQTNSSYSLHTITVLLHRLLSVLEGNNVLEQENQILNCITEYKHGMFEILKQPHVLQLLLHKSTFLSNSTFISLLVYLTDKDASLSNDLLCNIPLINYYTKQQSNCFDETDLLLLRNLTRVPVIQRIVLMQTNVISTQCVEIILSNQFEMTWQRKSLALQVISNLLVDCHSQKEFYVEKLLIYVCDHLLEFNFQIAMIWLQNLTCKTEKKLKQTIALQIGWQRITNWLTESSTEQLKPCFAVARHLMECCEDTNHSFIQFLKSFCSKLLQTNSLEHCCEAIQCINNFILMHSLDLFEEVEQIMLTTVLPVMKKYEKEEKLIQYCVILCLNVVLRWWSSKQYANTMEQAKRQVKQWCLLYSHNFKEKGFLYSKMQFLNQSLQ